MFCTEPLLIAEREFAPQRRQFIDWQSFTAPTGRYLQHHLIMGSHRTAFDSCHRTSLCDISHRPYPLHGLARTYLKTIHWMQGGEEPRICDSELFCHVAPLYFNRPVSGELVAIDLDAAYWQIYRVASLDLFYDGTGYPHNGHVKFLGSADLEPHKLLRNSVIGACRADTRTESVFGAMRRVSIGNRWQRPDLWAYIMDTLEAVAWDMRNLFGAVHVHTDGYILPHRDLAQDAIEYLQREWHLAASVRAEGEGIVQGLGSWSIADEVRGRDDDDELEGVPHIEVNESIDNMSGGNLNLRSWFHDAVEHFTETPIIYPSRLDGRPVPW